MTHLYNPVTWEAEEEGLSSAPPPKILSFYVLNKKILCKFCPRIHDFMQFPIHQFHTRELFFLLQWVGIQLSGRSLAQQEQDPGFGPQLCGGFIFIFSYACASMSMIVCAIRVLAPSEARERCVRFLGLDSQVLVTNSMWLLGIQFRAYGRAASIPNH